MRRIESTNKKQSEFGKDIGKSKDWVQSNELGRSDFKFKDLMRLAEKNNVDIIIVKEHFHHQLLKMKFSTRTTVLIIYLIDIAFAATSILITIGDNKELAASVPHKYLSRRKVID